MHYFFTVLFGLLSVFKQHAWILLLRKPVVSIQVVSIRIQVVKLYKKFDHFKLSLGVNKKNILAWMFFVLCGKYLKLFTPGLNKLLSKRSAAACEQALCLGKKGYLSREEGKWWNPFSPTKEPGARLRRGSRGRVQGVPPPPLRWPAVF